MAATSLLSPLAWSVYHLSSTL